MQSTDNTTNLGTICAWEKAYLCPVKNELQVCPKYQPCRLNVESIHLPVVLRHTEITGVPSGHTERGNMSFAPEYRVLAESSVVGLECEVIELLRQGWRLVGGMSILPGENGQSAVFYQAMTKGGKHA
jgi:hypothetical protein